MLDIRNLLKRYGIFIYTGSKVGDVDLMEAEVRDLYRSNILSATDFQQAILILRQERSNIEKKDV